MQFLFVDESGTPPPPDKVTAGDHFILGGVIIPEDIWKKVRADLERLKVEYGVTGEIKWRYFATHSRGSTPNSLSNLNAEEKNELRCRLFKELCKYKSVRIICIVADATKAYQQSYVNSPDDLYWFAYKQMTERFQYFLQDLGRTVGAEINGIIVCDHRGPKDDNRLRDLHHRLVNVKADTHSKYPNLIEGLFLAASHQSVGIQFADLVAGAVYRLTVKDDDRWWQLIKDSFRKSDAGKIEGFGLVKWPK